jgi:hypothetical protein
LLAEVTDDLEDQRAEVRVYLEQAGFQVLPKDLYPRDEAAFRAAAEADLKRSALFVQLLSELPGKKLAGSSKTVVACQHECANGLAIPRIQWRAREIDPKVVAAKNPEHGALLGGPDVLALGLEVFKAHVVQRVQELTRPPKAASAPPVAAPPGPLVFVNAEQADLQRAEEVARVLGHLGAWVDLPLRSPNVTPSRVRADLDRKLKDCQAFVLIYGQSPSTWVSQQLRRSRKVFIQKPLVVHFHGGLIDRPTGVAASDVLDKTYRGAGVEPIFFVWESGARRSPRTGPTRTWSDVDLN